MEAGLWEVDEKGVVCGIEKVKEADTKDRSYMYQLRMKWQREQNSEQKLERILFNKSWLS